MELPKARITVLETVYYAVIGDNPISQDVRFEQHLSSDEQPFQRQSRIKSDPKPLDLGWFADVPSSIGLIHIVNTENRYFQVNPTEEEVKALKEKRLLLSVDLGGVSDTPLPICEILPGESLRIRPIDPKTLLIASIGEATRSIITVYPK